MRRLIAHLDMDAFYASVELLRYPMLNGESVVIGGGRRHQPRLDDEGQYEWSRLRDYVGRGVITTATYPARAQGLHSAMGLMKAAALAPDAILLPVDFDQYRHYSRLFKAAVATVVPVIEDRGVDEIYLDLTEVPGAQESTPEDDLAGAKALGRRLKQAVFDATGLSCSIGISPNKLLSKICSDLDKPDGLTVLTMDEVPARIWPLPAKRINGIGPKANERLAAMGIHTIGELAAASVDVLQGQFGSNYGLWLHQAAHGRDERAVVTYREPKSISRETTFERNLHAKQDREALGAIFTRLCEQLAADLQRKGYLGKSIGIKLRFDDFKIVTRSVTLPEHTQDAVTIRRWAGQCLKTAPLDKRLRLLGVKADVLCRVGEVPITVQRQNLAQESLPLFGDL